MNEKSKVISGLAWRFSERFLAQIVSFIVSIVLARLLSPDEYGTVALVTIFITIGNVFVDGGFNNALVQKKDTDCVDYSTVFWLLLFISGIVYGIIWFIAPHIANFYSQSILKSVLRVLGLQIVFASLKSVQVAYIQKNMLFKKFFWATFGGTMVSGIVGIYMAYHKFGVWALVAQYLTNTFIDTIILWLISGWRPHFLFSIDRIKKLFSFGSRILIWNLSTQLFDSLRSLIIGKQYSASDLAYYNKGKSWPNLVIANINTSISSVMFPVLSDHQDNQKDLRTITKRTCSLTLYIISPVLFGLMALSTNVVRLILTEKWLPSIPFMCIACVYLAFVPIQTAHIESVKALGRSDILLKMDIVIKILQLTCLFISVNIGVFAIAFSSIIVTFISCGVYGISTHRLIGYKILDQIKDILYNIFPSTVMFICVYVFSLVAESYLSDLYIILIGIMLGMLIYVLISIIIKNTSFKLICGSILKKK